MTLARDTYAVLTRLPGAARLAPADAARLLDARFARDHGAVLATRDVRALPTYAAVGVQVEVVPSIGGPQ